MQILPGDSFQELTQEILSSPQGAYPETSVLHGDIDRGPFLDLRLLRIGSRDP
jgi:hypothetical protein